MTTGTPFYDGSVTHGGFRYRAYAPVKNWGVSARAVYDFTDDIALTAVFGYRKSTPLFSFDVDGSPLALENTRNNTGENYKSGEVRLAGKTGQVDWVGGVFLYGGEGACAYHTGVAVPGPAALPETIRTSRRATRRTSTPPGIRWSGWA